MAKQVSEVMEKAKVQLLADMEVAAKNLVNACFDDSIEIAKQNLKDAIPGSVDDAIIDMVAAAMVPELKKQLLAQIEKISQPAVVAEQTV